jgi:hypothetical protein
MVRICRVFINFRLTTFKSPIELSVVVGVVVVVVVNPDEEFPLLSMLPSKLFLLSRFVDLGDDVGESTVLRVASSIDTEREFFLLFNRDFVQFEAQFILFVEHVSE